MVLLPHLAGRREANRPPVVYQRREDMNRHIYEQTAIAAPYGVDEKEIEELERTRPGRPKPFLEQVYLVVFLYFWLATIGAFCIVYGLWEILDQAEFWPAAVLVFGIGSVAGIVVTPGRLRKYDETVTGSREYMRMREPKQKTAEPRAQPWVTNGMPGQESYKIGQFEFTDKEWRRLAVSLFNNDWRITRDALSVGVFVNLSKNYKDYIAEFVRLGWLPAGSEGSDELTAAGKRAFRRFLPPTLLNSGSSSGVTGSTTTTTTATTDQNGGER